MLKPPTGYNFTLFLGFDFDAESAEVYRRADPATISRGVYGAKKGVKRVLDILEEYGVKATFFVPGWVASRYGELVSAILNSGHEVAGHGFIHERLDEIRTREQEEKLFELMEESIASVAGARPAGFRAPYWRLSSNTLSILAERGYIYDSSLMDDDEPYIITIEGARLVELPVDWRLDDWPYLEYYRSLTPQQLAEMWIAEIEHAYKRGGYLSLTMHPQCIARGARIEVLKTVLERALDAGAWIPRGVDLARHVLEGKA